MRKRCRTQGSQQSKQDRRSHKAPWVRFDRIVLATQPVNSALAVISLFIAQALDGIELGGVDGRHHAADHADQAENDRRHRQAA